MPNLTAVCERVGYSKKNAVARITKCRITKGKIDGKGALTVRATLTPKSLKAFKAKRKKRSAQAKKRFGSAKNAKVEWQCKSWKEHGKTVVGSNCKREVNGLGGKPRTITQKTIVLGKK